MKPPTQNNLEDLLLARYKMDPEKFRSLLPEVAQFLDASPRQPHRVTSPFGLTVREREHHQTGLHGVLKYLEEDAISRGEAAKGLEHCATLIRDDTLPAGVGHSTLIALLKSVLGKSPGSFKSVQTVAVGDDETRQIVFHISLVKGAKLNLDRDMRLVSITVTPSKVRQRRKMLRFVGAGKDVASDVAARHDDYLAEQSPHAAP